MYISQDDTQFGGTESLENSSPDLQVCVFSSLSNWFNSVAATDKKKYWPNWTTGMPIMFINTQNIPKESQRCFILFFYELTWEYTNICM